MKTSLCPIIFSFFTLQSSHHEPQATPAQLPFSITINCAQPPVALHNIVNNSPSIISTTNQETKVTTTQEQETVHSTELLHTITIYGQSLYNTIKEKAIAHSGKIIIGICCGLICASIYYLRSMKEFLHNSSGQWCLWRIDEHEIMLQQEATTQAEELLRAIQIRYYNIYDPTNNTTCLTKFGLTIEKEKKILGQYLAICSFLRQLCLTTLVTTWFYQEKAQAALDHLLFLEKQAIRLICTKNNNRL